MAAILTINGCSVEALPGATIFDCAERLGIRVPTSCHKQGKCKECMVEVSEGMEYLSQATDQERHLSGAFRLSCRTSVNGTGRIRCHTMRRGHMRIERQAVGLPLFDAYEPRPGFGLAMDLGTTTVVDRKSVV